WLQEPDGGRGIEQFRWQKVQNAVVAPDLLKNESPTPMKKNSQILKPRTLSLGDLILAVSSCTKNTKETVAAVADLLGSGQVRVENNGRFTRARVF
ncbi:MAG TPA: hypothetical protein VH188_06940, partial [Chthoniobacterales bacterium]|nr:hypothetical protein [Chthoniobacterales bacterium]